MTTVLPVRGRVWLRYGLWLAVPLAIAWALREVSLADVGTALRELTLVELAAVAIVNVVVILTFSGRWWALLRGQGYRVPYLLTSAYRLAGFAVSYFTPGTQFGGEPLQVHLIRSRHQVPLPAATASVVLDKTTELASNFAFLAVGLATVVRLDLQPRATGFLLLAGALALAILPIVYLAAAWRGRNPATWVAGRLGLASSGEGLRARIHDWLLSSEREVGRAAREAPRGLLVAAVFSIVSWGLILLESGLAMRFLGMDVSPGEVVAVVTATRLALFVPLPGAAGALEASLLLALTTLGFTPAQALSLAVLVRVRDVVFGGLGLWSGGWLSGEAPTRAARR